MSGGAGQKAMELTLNEEFQIDSPIEAIRTAGRTDFGIVTEVFDRYQIEHTDVQRQRFRDAYLERLPDCLKTLPGRILPGIVNLLNHLADRSDVTLAVLTGNYSRGAWIKLQHFGLDHHFKFGGFGDIHGERDDVARVAHTEAQTSVGTHIQGKNCCVIGDTPADIKCSRAIDATAIAVATGGYGTNELQTHEPDHLFEDLTDVESVTEAIVGSD